MICNLPCKLIIIIISSTFLTEIIEKQCEQLEPPQHGSMTGSLKFVQFECEKGYRISGARSRRCVNGVWNGLHPICEGKNTEKDLYHAVTIFVMFHSITVMNANIHCAWHHTIISSLG